MSTFRKIFIHENETLANFPGHSSGLNASGFPILEFNRVCPPRSSINVINQKRVSPPFVDNESTVSSTFSSPYDWSEVHVLSKDFDTNDIYTTTDQQISTSLDADFEDYFIEGGNKWVFSLLARAELNVSNYEHELDLSYSGDRYGLFAGLYEGSYSFRTANSNFLNSDALSALSAANVTTMEAEYQAAQTFVFEALSEDRTRSSGSASLRHQYTFTVTVNTTPPEYKLLNKADYDTIKGLTVASSFDDTMFDGFTSPTISAAITNGGAQVWGIAVRRKPSVTRIQMNSTLTATQTDADQFNTETRFISTREWNANLATSVNTYTKVDTSTIWQQRKDYKGLTSSYDAGGTNNIDHFVLVLNP